MIITGASSGIGEEFAGNSPAAVTNWCWARRADRLRRSRRNSAAGPTCFPPTSRSQDRATLFDQVAALGLVPDILVNNAGLAKLGPVAESIPRPNSA